MADFLSIRLQYPNLSAEGDHTEVEAISCNQCSRAARFKCGECEFDYVLCFDCARRCGREAHMNVYGEEHVLQYLSDGFQCLACTLPAEFPLQICNQCEVKKPTEFVMCKGCFADHDRLSAHTQEEWEEHNFRTVEAYPRILKLPEPYYPQPNERISCTECRRRIWVQFFKCTTCIRPYILCDTCANGGKIGKHRSHEFGYFIQSQNQPQAMDTNDYDQQQNLQTDR